MVIFELSEIKKILYGTSIPIICISILEWTHYFSFTPVQSYLSYKKLIYNTAIFAVFSIILLLLRYFMVAIRRTENQLINQNIKLKESNELILFKNKKLIQANQEISNKKTDLEQANKKIKANTKQELYLKMARDIQAQFLPDIPKKIKLYGGYYHFESIYKPSNQLSGDLYDFHIKGDRVKIFHGDIAGKNAPAMMVALNVRSELKHLLKTEEDPHVLMTHLNGLIRKIRATMAVCAGVYYELDLKTKQMTYVHMGFEDIYIIRDQVVIDLGKEGGAQLGYIEDIEYKQQEIVLQKGDMIVTLSDGMSDMKTQIGDRYSKNNTLQETLLKYVNETPVKTAKSLRDWLENEIETYTGQSEVYADDISVFIASYVG